MKDVPFCQPRENLFLVLQTTLTAFLFRIIGIDYLHRMQVTMTLAIDIINKILYVSIPGLSNKTKTEIRNEHRSSLLRIWQS